MGGAKTEWMEAQERGWSAPSTYVCPRCVEDRYLKQLIRDAVTANTCNYCGRGAATAIATEAGVVIKAVYGTVRAYYCEPSSGGVPYDGGYIIDSIGIRDVLENLGFDGHRKFVDAVIDAEVNDDHFVSAADGYWAGSHAHQVLSSAWQQFCHTVKYETRFHFANLPPSQGVSTQDIEVSQTLPEVTEQLRPLIRTLPAGMQIYRARVRRRQESWTPTDIEMGPPPPEMTSAGRMNPAGIPYLYTAFDQETARREVGIKGRSRLTVFTATFELKRPLTVVDLTQTPPIPSLFDVDNKDMREQALFIHEFVEAVSTPVTKDGREHIEYVPTQVVCEFLAQAFEPSPGIRLGGLVFPSSVHSPGKNLVIFPDDRHEREYQGVTFVHAGT